jgi:hypothetical protein
MDDLQERFVSAVMGALWGAFLGLMIAMALSLTRPFLHNNDYLVFNWVEVIAACSALFAVLGLLFKTSIAAILGNLIALTYTHGLRREAPDGLPWWVQILFFAAVAALAYWFF